jgi:hypothetical protein
MASLELTPKESGNQNKQGCQKQHDNREMEQKWVHPADNFQESRQLDVILSDDKNKNQSVKDNQ